MPAEADRKGSVCNPAQSFLAGTQQNCLGTSIVCSLLWSTPHEHWMMFSITGKLGSVTTQLQSCTWKLVQLSQMSLCLFWSSCELGHSKPKFLLQFYKCPGLAWFHSQDTVARCSESSRPGQGGSLHRWHFRTRVLHQLPLVFCQVFSAGRVKV